MIHCVGKPQHMSRIMSMVLAIFAILAVAVLRARAGDPPRVGDQAPDFTLPMATKDTIDFKGVTLSARFGNNALLLAFYPADWSGGCTKEMCTFRDNFAGLSGLGAEVYGISGDYVFSHQEWARHLDLPFALLSDHSHEVAGAYDSYAKESGCNRRTVYVIDRSGRIAYVDADYRAGSDDSFQRLSDAVKKLK